MKGLANYRSNNTFAKKGGWFVLVWKRFCASALGAVILSLAFPLGVMGHLLPWPDGWSELSEVAPAGIYGNRFLVVSDENGTNLITIDGRHYQGLSLVFRTLDSGNIAQEHVIAEETRLNFPAAAVDEHGLRHLVWQHRSDGRYRLKYGVYDADGKELERRQLLDEPHVIQEPQIAVHEDALHLLWVENRHGHYDIFHGRWDDGDFRRLGAVHVSTGTSARPALFAHGEALHAAWIESDPFETHLYHSVRTDDWSQPLPVGPASTSGGEGAVFVEAEDGVELLWSSRVAGRPNPIILAAVYGGDQGFEPPRAVGEGSYLRAVAGTPPALAWQNTEPQVFVGYWKDGSIADATRLNVRRSASMRPEIVRDDEEHLHVYWLEAREAQEHRIMTMNTRQPVAMPWLRTVGIDDRSPLAHLGFMFLATFMLSLVHLAMNAGVVGLAVGARVLLARHRIYEGRSLAYSVLLTGLLMLLLLETPLGFGQPAFYGLPHWLVSAGLAFAIAWVLLSSIRVRSDFEFLLAPLLWLFLYQVYALVPQALGMV